MIMYNILWNDVTGFLTKMNYVNEYYCMIDTYELTKSSCPIKGRTTSDIPKIRTCMKSSPFPLSEYWSCFYESFMITELHSQQIG